MKKITIQDIALAVNKSISTVSKALSDSHEVNKDTKRMICEYAEKNNFQSNSSARSLRTGRSNIIGVIVSTIGNSFFSQLLEGIDEVIVETDFTLVIMQSKENVQRERKCIDILNSRGVDGIIISPIANTPNIDYLQRLHDTSFPIVVVDRINNRLKSNKIGVKNFEGSYDATQHLVDLGHKRIVHVTGRNAGVIRERLNGFKDCLRKNKIPVKSGYILDFDLQDKSKLEEEIKTRLSALFATKTKPNAIFTATDLLTNKMSGILKDMGLRIPEDVALIGFSNSTYSSSFYPSLSCIYQPAAEMGRLGARKIIEMLDKKRKNYAIHIERIELETQLIIRESTSG
ncbi:LacI family DNA-binding transcriptional regulator [Sphingobacterium spiritivorum]